MSAVPRDYGAIFLTLARVGAKHASRDVIGFIEHDSEGAFTYALDREDAASQLRLLRKEGAYIERHDDGYFIELRKRKGPMPKNAERLLSDEEEAELRAGMAYWREA